jgi:REP element-mobilizing transposase RayT
MTPQPLYTRDNCKFSGPLRWGLTVFWRTPIGAAPWLTDLTQALEPDGVRLLGHRLQQPGVSQFSLSTLADTAPLVVVQRVKGRLQHLVRSSQPKAFQRNYALRSFGPANRTAVEGYIASQCKHHPMADARVESALARVQIDCPEVDLSQPRSTAHAIYWYNLHVVLVHHERWPEIRPTVLGQVSSMVERICRSKGYALARGAILTDHIHLAIGCPLDSAPDEIGLAFLNNLAFVYDMKPVFQFGAFVGTFGEYHDGAVVSDDAGPSG